MRSPVRIAVAALVTSVMCTGCGFGPGAGSGAISVRVTQDFGSRSLKTVSEATVPGSQTQMQLLQHHFTVSTKYGGGFVESIDGHSGTSDHYDWFIYENGVETKKGAAALDVKTGDHLWFDLHHWQATQTIPAVVGSFPEPFEHGINGQRYPTTLECGAQVKPACNLVSKEFAKFKIPASPQVIGTGSGPDTLSINVGLWSQLAPEVAGEYIDKGPSASGVYAHFSPDDKHLLLENPAGKVVKTLGPGAGLIAATADTTDVPTWLVGGTDEAGVMAAARAVTPATLADHFALAVQGDKTYPVPLVGH